MTYRNSRENVFDKQNPLELKDEEVDQLMELGEDAFKVLSGDGIVTLRAEVRDDAPRTERLSGDLESCNGCLTKCRLAIVQGVGQCVKRRFSLSVPAKRRYAPLKT